VAQTRIEFADPSGYESFMGRWSRAVAARFLRWIDAPRRARWLDAGCGTGILTEAVLDACEPAAVTGVDPARAQIEQAARGPASGRASFRQADALVINFIPRPLVALGEMRRVTAPGGIVAGYVWDFQRDLSPSGPLRQAMRAFGAQVPAIPGTEHSSLQALESLFLRAGLGPIRCTALDVTLAYRDFEDFWQAQTPGYSPTTKIIDAMTENERRRLKRALREALSAGPQGRIEYTARANAFGASVPA
jgi:SAM-dependent methyltransferase